MKRWIAVLCVIGLATTAQATLTGQWLLNEGSGTVAADSSGNGADLVLAYGSPNWYDPGDGWLYSFPGDSRFSATYPAGGFAFDMSQDFTFTATVQTVNDGTIMSRHNNETWEPGAKVFGITSGHLYFDCGWVGQVEGTTPVNDGQRHEVSVSFDASVALLTLWVDGQLDATATDWFGMSADWGGYPDAFGMHLGAHVDLDGGTLYLPYFGFMKDVRITDTYIPEPVTVLLLGLGGTVLQFRRRRS